MRLAPLWLLFRSVAAAPWTEENAKWNINFQKEHDPQRYFGQWEGHEYFPSPSDWRALSIYQLLTDRFVDGDPRNNELYDDDFDVRDMSFRHGGDFAGIRQKLPYIRGLGCKAIWISPVFENGRNSYHQYAMRDFTLLDPRLGTLEELRALTSEAHALGMYVVVDVVMNHMGNAFAFEGHLEGVTHFRMHDQEETPRASPRASMSSFRVREACRSGAACNAARVPLTCRSFGIRHTCVSMGRIGTMNMVRLC